MNAIILRRRKLGRDSAAGIEQFSTTGIRQVRNWVEGDWPEPQRLDTHGPLIIFRWGCTSNVPEGARVVNTAKAIHWCSDKRQGRLDMQAAGVPVPKTWDTNNLLCACEDGIDDPQYRDAILVFRPTAHAQGRNLFVGTMQEAYNDSRFWDDGVFAEGYASLLIGKVAEYRVFVCQNRAVWVAKKTPGNPDQVAWNVAQGGRFDNVRWGDWPLAVVKAALAAAKVSGTDFSGVDVMVDGEGNPYVLEVNSAPSQTSPYRQSCVAKAFDYIVRNGKEHFPDVADSASRTYKSYIHPAVQE